MEIRKGEYLSIAGPSGCGKSTLLSILGLLDTPTAGSYSLNGHAVANLSMAERARIRNREIGFIFQSFNLIGDLSVFENVELPLTYRGMKAADRKTRVTEALEKVGMAHRAKHLPSQLSGGQQQRVAVARALVGHPLILLADEPTGNLDSKNGEAVMALLQELHHEGATICMVTHDPRFCPPRRPHGAPVRRPGGRGRRGGDGVVSALITLRHVEKFYQHGVSRTYVLRRVDGRDPGGGVRLDHGAVGRGQVHAPAHPRHARQRLGRRVLLPRTAGPHAEPEGSGPRCTSSTSGSSSRATTCSTT